MSYDQEPPPFIPRGQQTQGRSAPRKGKPDLDDYVDVAARIQAFYEQYPDGRLMTTEVRLTTEPDNVPRVMVQAQAYRDKDDEHPGVGWSWMELPGKTPYTKGSELENTETSAWGRAIAALGIATKQGIASRDEVRNKQDATEEAGGSTEPSAAPAAKESTTPVVPDKPAGTGPSPAMRDLLEKARAAFVGSAAISMAARRLYGDDVRMNDLTQEEVDRLWAEVRYTAEDTPSPEPKEPSTSTS